MAALFKRFIIAGESQISHLCLVKNKESLRINHHLKMSRQIFQVYLEPSNITSEKATKILDRLNSLNSAAEIMNVMGMYAGQRVFGIRIAKRILNAKAQAGKFRDLNQVATVPGIGYKRFTIIMSALDDRM